MTDSICVGFLLTVYVLPLIGLFVIMALIANIIEVWWPRKED